MASKRIWIVAFEFLPFPGGQATYAVEMARAFKQLGHHVTVIAPRYDNSNDKLESFEVKRVFEHQRLTFSVVVTIGRALWPVQQDDLVLAADIRAGIITTLLRPLRPFTKIVMFHGGEIKRSEYSLFAKFSNWLASINAKKIVANSSYTAQLVKAHIGGNPQVTLLGTARYWLKPATGAFENETLRNLDPAIPVVCTVARLESRKGHLVAMKALGQIAKQSSLTFKYVICGKAIYEDYTREVLRGVAALPEKFLYVGALSKDDVRRLYARSRVMILAAQEEPGFVEGFGLVITEAGAQGCPSISTRVGGIADAVIDGVTGLLYDPNDIDGLAAGIERLLSNGVERDHLGREARKYAESLTWQATAINTLREIT